MKKFWEMCKKNVKYKLTKSVTEQFKDTKFNVHFRLNIRTRPDVSNQVIERIYYINGLIYHSEYLKKSFKNLYKNYGRTFESIKSIRRTGYLELNGEYLEIVAQIFPSSGNITPNVFNMYSFEPAFEYVKTAKSLRNFLRNPERKEFLMQYLLALKDDRAKAIMYPVAVMPTTEIYVMMGYKTKTLEVINHYTGRRIFAVKLEIKPSFPIKLIFDRPLRIPNKLMFVEFDNELRKRLNGDIGEDGIVAIPAILHKDNFWGIRHHEIIDIPTAYAKNVVGIFYPDTFIHRIKNLYASKSMIDLLLILAETILGERMKYITSIEIPLFLKNIRYQRITDLIASSDLRNHYILFPAH